jgi:hypothetical protein
MVITLGKQEALLGSGKEPMQPGAGIKKISRAMKLVAEAIGCLLCDLNADGGKIKGRESG